MSVWILLTLSSLLCNGALYNPDQYGWLNFLFLIPVMYAAVTHELNFKHGFFWGVLFFSVHWYAWYVVCAQHASGVLRIIAVPLLTIYMAFFSGVWLSIGTSIRRQYAIVRASRGELCLLVATTYAYFWWMRTGVFWIFGVTNGYCFFSPLLPLAGGNWLVILAHVPASFLILCLIVCAACIVWAYVRRSVGYCALALVSVLPFFYGYLCHNRGTLDRAWLPIIAAVSPAKKQLCSLDYAQEIDDCLSAALAKNPAAELLITPESMYPYPLNEHPWAIELWYDNALRNYDQPFLIASHRKEGNRLYNTLYCVQRGRIIFYYDKILLAPFTEYTPWPWRYMAACNDCFLKNKSPFFPGDRYQTGTMTFALDGSPWTCVPAICSDLFFESPFLRKHPELPIVCVANDSWFCVPYFRRLMRLFAQMKAREWRRDIIYIGHDTDNCCLAGR